MRISNIQHSITNVQGKKRQKGRKSLIVDRMGQMGPMGRMLKKYGDCGECDFRGQIWNLPLRGGKNWIGLMGRTQGLRVHKNVRMF